MFSDSTKLFSFERFDGGINKYSLKTDVLDNQLSSGVNVYFDGKSVKDVPPHQRPVNTVFQKYALFPHLNVFENVAFGLRLKKTPEAEIRAKVKEMLAMVNLKGFEKKPSLVFVNHGDDDACVAFRNLLEEMGYDAEAPYSGTEYDLITGKMTVFTDGVRIKKTPKQDSRANQVYNELVAAAEALLMLVKGRKGRANKDNAKLTDQIRKLIEKWKE